MPQDGNEKPSRVLKVWIYAYAVFHHKPEIQSPIRLKLTIEPSQALPLVANDSV
jgi:hypothetical protein